MSTSLHPTSARACTVPIEALTLTAAIDTCPDRLELLVMAWGPGMASWGLDHQIIEGSPAEQATWDKAYALLGRTYPRAAGRQIGISATLVETGGHHTHEAYNFVIDCQPLPVYAIKGASRPNQPIISKQPTLVDACRSGKATERRVPLWFVGTDAARAALGHTSGHPGTPDLRIYNLAAAHLLGLHNSAAAAIEALLNRAKHVLLIGAWLGKPENVTFAKGSINSLEALQRGVGDKAAAKDASMGGYLPSADLQAAWAALPVDIEKLSFTEVQEFLRLHGLQVPFDPVADGDLDAVEQLEDAPIAVVHLDDEHGPARAELNDGASGHVDTSFVKTRL